MINKTTPEFSLEALKSGERNEFARFEHYLEGLQAEVEDVKKRVAELKGEK